MTGLADAYQDDVGALQGHTRLQAGVALLAAGTLLCLLALVVAVANPTEWGARRLAGALVGLAAPALAGGVVVILPASPRLRAAAAIGASLTLLGVAAFWQAYPEHWMGHGRELTPYVTGIYFLGMLTIALCLFAGIATLKRRNDPGGTVSLVVGPGETRVVEVESSGRLGGLGGIGLLGSTPEGDVETQTNRPDGGTAGGGSRTGSRSGPSSSRPGQPAGTGASSATASTGGRFQSNGPSPGGSSGGTPASSPGDASSSGGAVSGGASASPSGGSASTASLASDGASATVTRSRSDGTTVTTTASSGASQGAGAVSDGGSTPEPLHRPKGDVEPAISPEAADKYCGNCEHFTYVQTGTGMVPHCGYTGEDMDDMEACEDWSPNARRR